MQKKLLNRDAAGAESSSMLPADCILKFGYAKSSLEDIAKQAAQWTCDSIRRSKIVRQRATHRPVVCSAHCGYRAPSTLIFEEALFDGTEILSCKVDVPCSEVFVNA